MLESLFKQSLKADVYRCSSKYLFLKTLQIPQESTCAGVFFDKVAGSQNCNFIKRDYNTGFFWSARLPGIAENAGNHGIFFFLFII